MSTPWAPPWSTATACKPGDRVGDRHAQPTRVGRSPSPPSSRSGPSRCRSTPGGPRTSSPTRSTDSGSTVVLADPERVARMRSRRSAPGIRLIAVRSPQRPDAGRRRPLRGRRRAGDAAPDRSRSGPEDDATILYTSGTTGTPRAPFRPTGRSSRPSWPSGAASSSRSPARRGSRQPRPPRYPPTLILTVPLFHVTGCVPVMLSAFAGGIKLVIMYRWDAEKALQLIESERVHDLRRGADPESGTCSSRPNFHKYDTSSLVVHRRRRCAGPAHPGATGRRGVRGRPSQPSATG